MKDYSLPRYVKFKVAKHEAELNNSDVYYVWQCQARP